MRNRGPGLCGWFSAVLLICSALGPGYSAEARSLEPVHGRLSPGFHQGPSPQVLETINTVRIYLVALGDGNTSGRRIGCGDSLVEVTRQVVPTSHPLLTAMQILLHDHHRYYGQSGLYNALYRSRLTVQGIRLQNGRATVSLTGQFRVGGVCDNPRVLGQLRQTALQFPTVRRVAIFVNHVPLSQVLSGRGARTPLSA